MIRSVFLIIAVTASLNSGAQIEPVYEIYALKFASRGSTPISELATGGSNKDSVTLFFMFWLIKGNNGKRIIVDAGFTRDLDWVNHMRTYQRPDSVLAELNVRADEITDVILTHPHADHINGIRLYPNAHVWIQKEDYNYFVGEAWQKDGMSGGFEKEDVELLVKLNLSGKVTLVDGDDKELFAGIRVYTGSRHTYNSQYVLVRTGADRIIIASDNIWIYYNLNNLKSSPYLKGTFDTTAYVKSMQRMKTMASDPRFIIPGHDAAVFSKFPSIRQDVVRIR
jgi:glyoxylase-like metal-dependent hydrolase (beta-lactamase superfamily II)